MTTSEWKAARFCALLTQVQKADEEVSDLILSSALMTALEACAFPTSYEAICRTQAGKGASIAMRARAVLLDCTCLCFCVFRPKCYQMVFAGVADKTGKCHPGRSFKKDAAFLALVNAESKFQPNDPFEILRMVDSLRTETFAVKCACLPSAVCASCIGLSVARLLAVACLQTTRACSASRSSMRRRARTARSRARPSCATRACWCRRAVSLVASTAGDSYVVQQTSRRIVSNSSVCFQGAFHSAQAGGSFGDRQRRLRSLGPGATQRRSV